MHKVYKRFKRQNFKVFYNSEFFSGKNVSFFPSRIWQNACFQQTKKQTNKQLKTGEALMIRFPSGVEYFPVPFVLKG